MENIETINHSRFRKYLKYNTVEVCNELKEFIEKEKDVIMYSGICKKAGVNHQSIANLLTGHVQTLSTEYLNRVIPYFKKYGFIYSGFKIDLITIQHETCRYFNIPIDYMKSKTRKREIVQTRQFIFKFALEMTDNSSVYIGRNTGGFDHVTVLHGARTIENLVKYDCKIKSQYEELEHRLKQA